MAGLAFDLVELAPCPATPPSSGAPLRETAFREDGWLPDDMDRLRSAFAADEPLAVIGEQLNRTQAAISTKLADLGLRRNSTRSWTELDDTYLVQNYGDQATSAIAASLGRSAASVYGRAALLGLTEGNAPPYTDWEIAQIQAGYAKGIPVSQLAVLIGRPVSGLASMASTLGIRHANAPADWSAPELQRALVLAEEGHRYRQIAATLAAVSFPKREPAAVGQMLRKLGYGRGWGRPWLEEEKDLLRQAYLRGDSLQPLRERLGRSRAAIAHQTGVLGLHGTHARPNGWRNEPPWTKNEITSLRRDYGKVPTPELARNLGRTKGGVFNKAWSLGLRHGFMRPFSEDEQRAIHIARDHGISLTDLSAALVRDPAVISKYAIRIGIPFAGRTRPAPRMPRAQRARLTLQAILALDGEQHDKKEEGACLYTSARPARLVLAMPGLPPLSANLLEAMHQAGLLRAVSFNDSLLLLA